MRSRALLLCSTLVIACEHRSESSVDGGGGVQASTPGPDGGPDRGLEGGGGGSGGGAGSDGGVAGGSEGGNDAESGGSDSSDTTTADAGLAPETGGLPSEGCGRPAGQVTEKWILRMVTAAGVERRVWFYLPKNYDPQRPYPTVFLFHGCSDAGRENNNVPIQNASKEDAVLVRGMSVDRCWDTSANGPDVALFDEMVKVAQANFCVDSSRLFGVGYSSGTHLVNLLGCSRGNVLRATGALAGGLPSVPACVGRVAGIFLQDAGDNLKAAETARDRLLRANMCDTSITPVRQGPAPCVRYQGCAPGYPVDWCQTTGQGHNRQDSLTPGAFWSFFAAL